MTLAEFNSFSYERRLVAVFDEGTFLTYRRVEEGEISLFHLPCGFFVEVYCNTQTGQIFLLQSFASPALLEAYTSSIDLPADL